MGVRIRDLRNKIKTIDITIGEDTVAVSYRPVSMTAAQQDTWMEMVEAKEWTNSSIQLVVDLLADWEVYDADDPEAPDGAQHKVAIEAATIRREVPFPLVRAIVEGVMADLYPNQTSASTSNGSS